jgi:uncharacterized damage-inducible protein DinB
MPIEAWMKGPIDGVAPLLQPAAHAFAQAGDDIEAALASFPAVSLWTRPGGAASVAFHLRHVAGATDRLLAYARGEQLSPADIAQAKAEGNEDAAATVESLLAEVRGSFARALEQVRTTSEAALLDPREVGRARFPSNVMGLLFHAAEHATRHAGQLITTTKLLATP